MSLYKDASLVMLPSAYKDGKLYSIRPTDGSGDFTFSRGSNLAATRVDVNGLIEKGRENLVTYSNQFNNWDIDSIATLTGNQSGYNGNDAWYVVPSNFNGTHIVRKSSVVYQGLQTYSVYAKTAGYDIQLRATGIGGTNFWVSYDLTNGVVGTTGGGQIDAVITSVGNGWYRCSMAMESGAYTPHIGIYIVEDGATAPQSPSFAGNGSGVYIQDAQVEIGLVATDYIETGASTAQAGILEDMPRLDYSGGASCPALLLEPQRSNLYTYSEYYDSYTKVNLSVTTNAITSPEGIQNASKLVSGSGLNIKRIQPSISTTGTNEYIISAFVKKAEWDYFFIYGAGTLVNGAQAIFNLDNGTIEEGGGHSTIEAFGDDGWYKITWKTTSTGTGTGDPRIGITDNASSSNSTGDGTSGVYLYGLQIEEGSYPTSYIPTYGSSVTRLIDDTYTPAQDELTSYCVLVDLENLNDGGGSARFIDKTTADISIHGGIYLKSGAQIGYYSSSTSYIDNLLNVADGARHKYLLRVTNGFIEEFFDGTKQSNTGTNSTDKYNRIRVTPTNQNPNIHQLVVFPTALTDSECIALTTL